MLPRVKIAGSEHLRHHGQSAATVAPILFEICLDSGVLWSVLCCMYMAPLVGPKHSFAELRAGDIGDEDGRLETPAATRSARMAAYEEDEGLARHGWVYQLISVSQFRSCARRANQPRKKSNDPLRKKKRPRRSNSFPHSTTLPGVISNFL